MTEPTDEDRKVAAELIWHTLPREQVEAVAQALAEERAKFLALADELDADDSDPGWAADPDYWAGLGEGANRIRQAVIGTERAVSTSDTVVRPVTPDGNERAVWGE